MKNKIKKNCTTVFMVAPFGVGRERLASNGFIGAYLGDVDKPELHYERGIYFLFKPENIMDFQDFLYEERERGAKIVEDYDYEEGFVVMIYLLDDRYKEDYKKFLEGKYSKFSQEFKKNFPEKVIINTGGYEREEITTQQRIFNKDISLKEYWEDFFNIDMGDLELWSKPNLEKDSEEYINITKINMYV